MIGLANSRFNLARKTSLDDIFRDSNTKILIKESIVYGPYLETRISEMKAQKIATYAEFTQMITMIFQGRADLTFIPFEEANYYLSHSGYSDHDLKIIRFSGMPPGEKRHIMCSLKVSDETMVRLNDAIARLNSDGEHSQKNVTNLK